jgi:hypothetical protein
MSKSLDQLARNLAGGMSRRKALWQFVSGLGVVATLTGRRAYAGYSEPCSDYCEEQAEIFKSQCLEYSAECPPDYCADMTLTHMIGINGIRPCFPSFNGHD